MTFSSSFGRTFSPTFQPKSQAVSGGWWLAGGIPTSNCIAAYQSKGAIRAHTIYRMVQHIPLGMQARAGLLQKQTVNISYLT